MLLPRENHSEGRFLTLKPNKDTSGLFWLFFFFFLALEICLLALMEIREL